MKLDNSVLVAVIIVLAFGFLNKLIVPAILVSIAVVYFMAKPEPAPALITDTGQPKVEPIRVQRVYTGPKSIYPEKMEIHLKGEKAKQIHLKEGAKGTLKELGRWAKYFLTGKIDEK
ncbi:MAG: hypothetical protein J4432_01100 [DPANN group archaeon]|nr:hypothetical protein [DPANN group archaeon]